jgi:hypothetical protein
MPLFYDLDGFGDDTARIAGRLAAILEAMHNHPQGPNQSVPNKNATETLLLATWNLQAFDGGETDRRTDESYWYIAEIVSHFDLIAIQEVGANLGALEKLKYRLGGTWNYVVSDVTQGKAGNKERLAFLFDRRKIRFSGVAGEIVVLRQAGSVLCCPRFILSGEKAWKSTRIEWLKFRVWPAF